MFQGSNHPGVTVIIVERLGRPAQIVNTSGPRLLLLDSELTCEERIRIMATLLDRPAA
jgi:hypothetical protein